ncbi:hypothetical protein ACWDD9_18735, partial [Kitasatospora sp. NPDC001119]
SEGCPGSSSQTNQRAPFVMVAASPAIGLTHLGRVGGVQRISTANQVTGGTVNGDVYQAGTIDLIKASAPKVTAGA